MLRDDGCRNPGISRTVRSSERYTREGREVWLPAATTLLGLPQSHRLKHGMAMAAVIKVDCFSGIAGDMALGALIDAVRLQNVGSPARIVCGYLGSQLLPLCASVRVCAVPLCLPATSCRNNLGLFSPISDLWESKK
jgi:hypothetical protein